MVGRPKNPDALVPLEVGLQAKAMKYIDILSKKGGFGSTRPEVIRFCVWHVIHDLIEKKRLPEID
jgi:hypothetical protein